MMAAAAMILAGCTGNDVLPEENYGELVADTEDMTFESALPVGIQVRTTLGDEEGHKSVSWSEDDKVRVFYGADHADGDVSVADGSISVSVGASETYGAVYPLLEGSVDGSSVSVVIPAVQDGTFASANVMAALTDASARRFSFRNVAGILSFDVTSDDLTKVVIRSNDGCPVAGRQTLVFGEDGNVSDVEYAEDAVPEITVSLNGKGTYYAAVMMNVDMKVGFGMRFYKGDEPLSGVLSRTPVVMTPDLLQHIGNPEIRISGGDYYIRAGASGSGTSWSDAGGEELLYSLLGGSQSDDAVMDGVTLGWRLHGKTIHVAAGLYNIGKNTGTVRLKDISGLEFSLKGGYPANVSSEDAEPDAGVNETRLTVDGGSILDFENLTDADIRIDGIFFFGGNSKTDGGAVDCDITGTLKFTGCTFRENRSDLGGGAVNVTSGNVHFTNCLFDQNTAGDMNLIDVVSKTGWKVECCGGAFKASGDDSQAYFDNCTFKNNMAHATADIYLLSGATAYANKSVFYGSAVGQYKNETYYHASSVTAEEGADNVQSVFCVNNSTFTGASSNYAQGLPTVNALSSRVLICNTTIVNKGINLVLCRKKTKQAAELHAHNNMLLNLTEDQPSINLNAPYAKNGYMNVVCVEKNNWKLDENDIQFSYSDFTMDVWDWNKGYLTWTLNEGKEWPAEMAVQTTLSEKVAAAMPDFDTWLRTVDTDPYGTDQSGASRNPGRMTPGAWESSNL